MWRIQMIHENAQQQKKGGNFCFFVCCASNWKRKTFIIIFHGEKGAPKFIVLLRAVDSSGVFRGIKLKLLSRKSKNRSNPFRQESHQTWTEGGQTMTSKMFDFRGWRRKEKKSIRFSRSISINKDIGCFFVAMINGETWNRSMLCKQANRGNFVMFTVAEPRLPYLPIKQEREKKEK